MRAGIAEFTRAGGTAAASPSLTSDAPSPDVTGFPLNRSDLRAGSLPSRSTAPQSPTRLPLSEIASSEGKRGEEGRLSLPAAHTRPPAATS